jgi:hypothetical protein
MYICVYIFIHEFDDPNRCRNVSKPKGSKPGLVQLNGDVATIRIDVKAESKRLERLEKTKEVIA